MSGPSGNVSYLRGYLRFITSKIYSSKIALSLPIVIICRSGSPAFDVRRSAEPGSRVAIATLERPLVSCN
eukprot:3773641-Prymnesium_polylepis.1